MAATRARRFRELYSELESGIGAHSYTHHFLPDLPPAHMRAKIVDSKRRLEESVGRPVGQFSCTRGRWSRTVATVAEEAGYRSVATSRVGVNRPGADRYALARIVLLRDTADAAVLRARG